MTTQIDADALNQLIGKNAVKVIDGSWALDGTDMRALFTQEHIPGAQFLDIEAVSDHATNLPHMAPSPDQFAQVVGSLGISRDDHVVVYDRQGLFSAARIWWLFRLMGHDRVEVLRGGLPAWKAAGLPVTDVTATASPAVYVPSLHAEKIISLDALREQLDTATILDARSAARFTAQAPEPRTGLRGGHIPGSRSLPFTDLIRDGALKSADELRKIFVAHGVTDAADVVTSCGSGVTAAIITLALEEIGLPSRLYDGSWSEWGQPDLDTPVETGA